ncbi:MAG: endolytic transglycosylase MltG [Anaerolineales bacterium]
MKRKSTPKLALPLLLVAFIFALIACSTIYNYISQIPSRAEQLFGPASIQLDTWQHYTTAYRLVENQALLLTPTDPFGGEIIFTVSWDDPTASIISRLADQGLIADQGLFRDYLVYSGIDTQLQSGDFYLSAQMTGVEIAHNLLDATPLFATLSIIPGWRLEEIAASLPTTGLAISPEEFLAAASQRYPKYNITQQVPQGYPLEGLFPPGMVEVERSATAEQLVRFLLEKREESLTNDLVDGFTQQGLSTYQGIILASIVERETIIAEEMPLIASVFLNRLTIPMKLETDPTVQYALGYNSIQNSWWTNPLSLADLEINSIYNTYRYPGLPPTPIASPSTAALQAVAYPAQTPYYYFRAACDGSGRHNFSETFDQHLQNACP